MNRTALFRLIAILILMSPILLAGCNSSTALAFEEGEEDDKTYNSIGYLKSLCTSNSITITRDINVKGFITANSLYGEFYKTIIISDGRDGISVAVNTDDLYRSYPVGAAITLYCNGMALGNYGGKIQAGAPPGPGSEYSVERLGREDIAKHLRIDTSTGSLPEPTVMTFDAVGARHIDTYVCFDNVRFVDEGPWCDKDPLTSQNITTERMIIDDRGQTFIVRTLGTCKYANEPLPQGTGSLYGIIDYFNKTYSLRISDHRIVFP